jgi:hypothetical protein
MRASHNRAARPGHWPHPLCVRSPRPTPDNAPSPIKTPQREKSKYPITFPEHITICRRRWPKDREGPEALPGILPERGIASPCLPPAQWVSTRKTRREWALIGGDGPVIDHLQVPMVLSSSRSTPGNKKSSRKVWGVPKAPAKDQLLVSNPHEPHEQPSRGSKDVSMHKASAGRFPLPRKA